MGAHIDQCNEEPEQSSNTGAACRYKLRTDQRKKERHHDMPQNEPREIGFGTKQGWDFLVRALHKRAVPNEAKDKDETKRGKECDREFFPVHNLFRVEALVKAR